MATTPPTKILTGGKPVEGCVPSSNILISWPQLVRETSGVARIPCHRATRERGQHASGPCRYVLSAYTRVHCRRSSDRAPGACPDDQSGGRFDGLWRGRRY